MSCFFFLCSCAIGQERFNVREVLELTAGTFKGVVEFENIYLVSGTGILPTDSGFYEVMHTSFFDVNGEHSNVMYFTKEVSHYLLNPKTGLDFINSEVHYCTLGQTYDENSESAAGFLASFNEQGDTNFVKLFHSPYIEQLDPEFDFIAPLTMCPSTNPDNSFFISTNISNPESTVTDCYIQRMTPEGETLWQYIYATEANPDNCKSMIPTESGGVLAGVWQFGPIDLVTKFIELDSNGVEISTTTIEMEGGAPNDMILNNNNQIILVSRIGLSEGEVGSIHKFDLEGNLIWQELRGDPDPLGFSQEFTNIVHTQDGKYVAGGINYEYVENPTDTSGTHNENGWLVKIDDDGNVEWDRKYSFIDSPQDKHTINDLKATSDGGFIFCGESTDEDPNQEFTEGPPQQGWLVKVDSYGCLVEGCHLSDNINVIEQNQEVHYFKAGPIPAGQFLNIYQSATAHLSTYQLINSAGQVVEEFPAMSKGTTMMLDVSRFAAGSYQLVLRKENEVFQSEKILVN